MNTTTWQSCGLMAWLDLSYFRAEPRDSQVTVNLKSLNF